MIITRIRMHTASWRASRRPLLVSLGFATALALVAESEAAASTYHVYTTSSSDAHMKLDADDGYCSLAEAIAQVNGFGPYDCTDQSPSSTEHTIELRAAFRRSFSSYPYKVASELAINSSKRVTITAIGGQAFIDSTAYNTAFSVSTGKSAFFQRVTITYKGTGTSNTGGRLISNYGTLSLYSVTLAKGNVTALSGSGGDGGGLYNKGTITNAQYVVFDGNRAKRGGGLFNDAGFISNLGGTITGNSATVGGGIYNRSTAKGSNGLPTNGIIKTLSTTVTSNTAKAGGGIFNRGEITMEYSYITSNTVSGTGSGETCGSSQSCDGAGGGVVNVPASNNAAVFRLSRGSSIDDNVASGLGGAVYSSGVLNLINLSVSRNKARSGAAIYLTSGGTSFYCELSGNDSSGDSEIDDNSVTRSGGYSIVDGDGTAQCIFYESGGEITAAGNSSPTCKSSVVHSSSSCPQ